MANFCRKNKSHFKDCKSKKRYYSEDEALKVGKRFNQRAYYCYICDGWHLTSRDYNGGKI